jgi:L-iditol 2-dehydrogenase
VTDDGAGVDDVDVAIEASGAAGGLQACLRTVVPAGRLVQIGIFGREIRAAFDLMLVKEIAFSSGFASPPRSWRRAMALIEDRTVQLDPLVSEVAPLSAWERVFGDLRAGRGMKAILDPRER